MKDLVAADTEVPILRFIVLSQHVKFHDLSQYSSVDQQYGLSVFLSSTRTFVAMPSSAGEAAPPIGYIDNDGPVDIDVYCGNKSRTR